MDIVSSAKTTEELYLERIQELRQFGKTWWTAEYAPIRAGILDTLESTKFTKAPHVNPSKDGGVEISWDTKYKIIYILYSETITVSIIDARSPFHAVIFEAINFTEALEECHPHFNS